MSKKKWKRFMREVMNRDLKRIIEEVNSDPSLQDVVAPEELHDKVFNRIREYEEEQEKQVLSREEKELIHLGRVYKRKRKWNKYIVLAAAVVCALAFGLTSVGGPKRVFEEVRWMLGDREQTNVNTDDERINNPDDTSEGEAYEQIEDAFGFYPVRLDYKPEGMEFTEVVIEEETQTAKLYYTDNDKRVIRCRIITNYRTGSLGVDVEDELIQEYNKEINGVTINIKKYLVEENKEERWQASFEHQNAQYSIMIMGVKEAEVNKIIENLYFF